MCTRSLIISAVMAPLALAAQAPATPPCEHIQLRFADKQYQLGMEPVPSNDPRIYRNSATGWSYALNDTVLLDEHAIVSVGTQSSRLGLETNWSVVARLTMAGGRALTDATAKHAGRYLGIVIGNDLVDTPFILNGVSGTFIQLRGIASAGVADSLAARAARAIELGCVDPEAVVWLKAPRAEGAERDSIELAAARFIKSKLTGKTLIFEPRTPGERGWASTRSTEQIARLMAILDARPGVFGCMPAGDTSSCTTLNDEIGLDLRQPTVIDSMAHVTFEQWIWGGAVWPESYELVRDGRSWRVTTILRPPH